MKSIIYILLSIFIASILFSAIPKSQARSFQVITIESVEKNPDSCLIYESASIIKSRLKDYGLEKFEIKLNTVKNEIYILLDKNVKASEFFPLIFTQGKIGFYETYDRNDVIKKIEPGDSLLQLMEIDMISTITSDSSPIIGNCQKQNIGQVNQYIANHYMSAPGEGIHFVWGYYPNSNGAYNLYMLKQYPVLNKEHIQMVRLMEQGYERNNELILTFNANASVEWNNITKSNIGKSIAMVIDHNVFYAPKVMSEINEGKCLISGNFAKQEINFITSIINNKILPLEFRLVN